MKIVETKFEDVYLPDPVVHGDSRGFFMESYNRQAFEKLGIHLSLVQDNHSLSAESGTVRGLHYQLNPKAQTKIVRVLVGAIYDVILDLRRNSRTFG